MSVDGRNPSSGAVILVANESSFEAGYVAAVLKERGIEVLVPVPEMQSVVEAIAASERCRVVVCHALSAEERADLSAALARHDVPCLTLTGATATQPLEGESVLVRPFAAHQVADWVARQQVKTSTAGDNRLVDTNTTHYFYANPVDSDYPERRGAQGSSIAEVGESTLFESGPPGKHPVLGTARPDSGAQTGQLCFLRPRWSRLGNQ